MRVEIDLKKSVEENASAYFEKSKKAKQKLIGLGKAVEQLNLQLAGLEQKKSARDAKAIAIKKRKRAWFEQYRWFFSSDGFLVIGGKDAKQNDEIVKKRLEATDVYFHADVFGALHCILKSADNSAPEASMKEAAQFAAAFSRAWQSNAAQADVYSVLPSQVSKEAPTGEALGKGAFMIYGERKWFKRTALSLALGIEKTEDKAFRIISGPESAVKKHALAFVSLKQGADKKSDAAKKILSIFQKKLPGAHCVDLDEILQMLPGDGIKVIAE